MRLIKKIFLLFIILFIMISSILTVGAHDSNLGINGNNDITYDDCYEDKYVSNAKSSGTKGMESLSRKLPAEISIDIKEKIQNLAIQTFKALGCNGVSRIDFIIDTNKKEIYVNEINTIPGCLSFYLWNATGIQYSELLERLIELTLKRQREEKDIEYDFDTNILSGINLNGLKGTKNKLG